MSLNRQARVSDAAFDLARPPRLNRPLVTPVSDKSSYFSDFHNSVLPTDTAGKLHQDTSTMSNSDSDDDVSVVMGAASSSPLATKLVTKKRPSSSKEASPAKKTKVAAEFPKFMKIASEIRLK